MACFAPKARANCVTALPTDPPIAGARHGFACPKTSEGESHLRGEIRDRNTCGTHVVDTVRNQAKVFLPYGNPLTVGSILKNAIRRRENITREPTGKSVPPPSSTTPAPSLPRTNGAFARGNLPERIVWSSGVTPAAVIRSSTFPSETAGFGRSTSFNPS